MHVLIVDKDQRLAITLARELQRLGHEPRVAVDINAAANILANDRIDVMLTELNLGRDDDGFRLLQLAGRIAPKARPILMGEIASAEDYKRAMRCGAIDLLTKPFSPAQLRDALGQAKECGHGIRAMIHGIQLPDLLQMIHHNKRSLTVVVGDGLGRIHMEDGELVHASAGSTSGELALRSLLARHVGSVATLPAAPCPRTISRSFDSLLLDLMCALDEHNRDQASLDGYGLQPKEDDTPYVMCLRTANAPVERSFKRTSMPPGFMGPPTKVDTARPEAMMLSRAISAIESRLRMGTLSAASATTLCIGFFTGTLV